jgi:outer membrane protein assembly factor BamA
VAGLVLEYRSSSRLLRRPYWGARLRGEGLDRIYFLDQTELNQRVSRGGLDVGFGFPWSRLLAAEVTFSLESVEPESSATVYRDREVLGRERGREIRFEELPAEIQGDLGRREQGRLVLSVLGDNRRGRGLLTRGGRGRLRVEGVFSEEATFLSLAGDVRGHAPLASGVQLAGRVRGGMMSDEAPFYERFYLGGLYTVRGYPSQSLSPPEGNLRLLTASLELRASWVGPPENPRVTGLVFLDSGWSGNGRLDPDAVAFGAGFGLRVRLPWLQQVGLDIGIPLSSSPFDDSFHANISLGWTY